MKTGVGFGIVVCSKTKMRCLLCAVYIPNSLKSIELHGNGVKHRGNLELVKKNAILVVESTVYCRPCIADIQDDESITQHVESEFHTAWMNALKDLIDGELITADLYLSGEGDHAHCELCEEDILCVLEKIEEHVWNFDHRLKVMSKLKPLKGIFYQNSNDDALCKVCDVYMENSISKIVEHVENCNSHAQLLAKYEGLAESHHIYLDDYFDNKQEKNAYCNTCEYEVPGNIDIMIEHVNTTAHSSNLYLMEVDEE